MSERWKPENGETYWSFDFYGNVHQRTYDGDSFDSQLMALGNMFERKKEAEAAFEKTKAFLLSLQEPVTDCNQLPKLTAEVFDRPDCPEWAEYAAVTRKGNGIYLSSKPSPDDTFGVWHGGEWDFIREETRSVIKWDASGWQNSLIERPEKKQAGSDSEWRKVGEWVTYYEDNRYKYFKIAKIELNRLYSEDGKFSLMCDVGKARLRPYNAEEMKALVGKVLKHSTGNYLVTGFENRWNQVKIESVWREANELAELWKQLDDSPCGVLEHLENGEWVE